MVVDDAGGLRSLAGCLGLVWLGMLAGGCFPGVGEGLVALAIAVVVPLGVALSRPAGFAEHAWTVARDALFIGGPLALASFLATPGSIAGMLTIPWVFTTALVAWSAVVRIARRGPGPVEEFAIDAAHVYLPVGAIWLVASRFGVGLLGFVEPVVLYTSVHFHYAGFAAPVVVGIVGRALPIPGAPTERVALRRRVQGASTAIVLAGVPLVAAGIQISRTLELPAAILLAIGMLGASGGLVTLGARRVRARAAGEKASGAFLVAAGACLVVSMTLAVLFTTTGSATRGSAPSWIPYTTMALLHGSLNATFACLGLLAFTLAPAGPAHGRLGGTWPRRFGTGFVGPHFFDHLAAPARPVTGQVASLDVFPYRTEWGAPVTSEPAQLHPVIRDFYEHTDRYELVVRPTWFRPFRRAGRLFSWFARRFLGNLELPTGNTEPDVVRTRLFAIDDPLDPRMDVRAYVRTYVNAAGERANYVAAYSTHTGPTGTLLSAAFPLPFCTLVGVLRFEWLQAGGVCLKSGPRLEHGIQQAPQDEGMFLVTPVGVVRLPVEERILVLPNPVSGGLVAQHRVRVFGRPAFSLEYSIIRLELGAGDLPNRTG